VSASIIGSSAMRASYTRGARWLFMALTLVGCADKGSDTPASDAFCADLRSGLTIMNIYGGVRARYDSPADFAQVAYGHALISCPGELTTNEGLRTFLQAWGINPDA
jgi:hypothetical protein